MFHTQLPFGGAHEVLVRCRGGWAVLREKSDPVEGDYGLEPTLGNKAIIPPRGRRREAVCVAALATLRDGARRSIEVE